MPHVPRLSDARGGQFHGGVTHRREIDGAVMVYTAPSENAYSQKPMHWHARPYFWMLVDGDCKEQIKGVGERIYAPMVLTYHPKGEVHSHAVGRRAPTGFGIVLLDDLLLRTGDLAPIVDEPTVLYGAEFRTLADRILDEFRLNDGQSTLALEGLTFELMAQTSRLPMARRDAQPPRWLVNAMELLQARYAESLKFTEIAAAVGIHPVHLAAEFRRHFGCTMGTSLRSIRLSAAKRALRESGRSVAE